MTAQLRANPPSGDDWLADLKARARPALYPDTMGGWPVCEGCFRRRQGVAATAWGGRMWDLCPPCCRALTAPGWVSAAAHLLTPGTRIIRHGRIHTVTRTWPRHGRILVRTHRGGTHRYIACGRHATFTLAFPPPPTDPDERADMWEDLARWRQNGEVGDGLIMHAADALAPHLDEGDAAMALLELQDALLRRQAVRDGDVTSAELGISRDEAEQRAQQDVDSALNTLTGGTQ